MFYPVCSTANKSFNIIMSWVGLHCFCFFGFLWVKNVLQCICFTTWWFDVKVCSKKSFWLNSSCSHFTLHFILIDLILSLIYFFPICNACFSHSHHISCKFKTDLKFFKYFVTSKIFFYQLVYNMYIFNRLLAILLSHGELVQ